MSKKKTTAQALKQAAEKHGAEFSLGEYASDHFMVGAQWMRRHLASLHKKAGTPKKPK